MFESRVTLLLHKDCNFSLQKSDNEGTKNENRTKF